MIRRRPTVLALLLVATAVLASCRSTTSTSVRFDREGRSRVTVSLALDGEARDAVASTPELRQRVDSLVHRWFPSATSTDGGGVLRWSATATPEQVVAASGLTGISRLEPEDGEDPSVRLRLVVPRDLVAAVEGGDDPAAVPALKENIFVGAVVTFPAGVEEVSAGRVPVRRAARSVTVSQPLAGFQPGDVTVSGRLSDGFPWAPVLGTVALLAVTVTVVVQVRRPAPTDGELR